MEQLIPHLIGDYVTQSDWMAGNKTKAHFPAFAHALTYSLPFLLIGSPLAVMVIFALHFVIDRWRLARFVCWLKNIILHPLCPICLRRGIDNAEEDEEFRRIGWGNCKATGYPSEKPAWLTVWLLIACDNTIHLATNYLALLCL